MACSPVYCRMGADKSLRPTVYLLALTIPVSDQSMQCSKSSNELDMLLRQLVRSIRKQHPSLPLVAMTYSNILVRAGMEKFMIQSKRCGLDGFILPDMPVEEGHTYSTTASQLNLATIWLVSPNTPKARLLKLVASTSGFLYVVSVYGITGVRNSFQKYTLNTIRAVKQVAGVKVPVAVGFGISRPAQARS